ARLARIEPVFHLRAGHRQPTSDGVNLNIVLSGFSRALVAFGVIQTDGFATLADDLDRLPATRQIVGLRHGTGRLAALIERTGAEVPVILRVTVPGIDLDEIGLLRVVVFLHQLQVPGGIGRRVYTPGAAVGNHHSIEAPLIELLE